MKFSDIPGHSNTKDALRQLVDKDKLPHAIMLTGVSGIGKVCLARALMQYAHCQNRRDGEPCGVCQSCRQHVSFNHPDVHFLFPYVKSKTKKVDTAQDVLGLWQKMLNEHDSMPIEQWLELIEAGNSQLQIYVADSDDVIRTDSLSSFNSKYKFIFIWLPEKLQLAAANKLLKVIEEPSPGTSFILVSNNDADVLPTISSRTQRFNMHPLSESEVAGYLSRRYNMPPSLATQYAHLSSGRMSKADEFGQHTGERGEFNELFQKIMRAAYAKRPGALREIGDNAAGMGREKLRRFLEFMSRMVRENFIYNLGVAPLNELTPEETAFSSKFSPFVHHGNVEQIIAEIERASTDIARNGNSKLILFSFFLYLIPLLHKKPT